jgi:tripartite-type tricarboxylate transporter receptor subunit TctC
MKRILFLAAALATYAGAGAKAQPVEDFYKGQKLSWILSAGEGGGYSTYARFFAPLFAQKIPGNPSIVIQNMPGAGGIRAMMHLANVAPRDGSVIGLVHASVPFAPLYGTKGANFDPRQMSWIGSISTESAMCVAWSSAKIDKWQDLFDGDYVVGGTGAGSQMEMLPHMLNRLFGTKIKIVSGYRGGNDVYMAMERGEVHGRCGGLVTSINTTRPEWFSQKKVTIPVLIALKRKAEFPEAPAVIEFARDERTKKILELVLAPQGMDRPILAPPNIPASRLAALRTAFTQTMNDPGFIAEAKKQNIEIDEVSGEEVAAIIVNSYAAPRELVEAAKEIMNIGSSRD